MHSDGFQCDSSRLIAKSQEIPGSLSVIRVYNYSESTTDTVISFSTPFKSKAPLSSTIT